MDKKEKVPQVNWGKRCFRKVWDVLWFGFPMILCAALVAGISGFIAGKFVVLPTYESTAMVAVWVNEEGEGLSEEEIRLNELLVGDYMEMLSSRRVAEQVTDRFGLGIGYEEFLQKMEVILLNDSHMVSVTVKDSDSELAKQMLDEICRITAKEMEELLCTEAVHVIDEGQVADTPAEPDALVWMVVGILLGGFAAAVVCVLRDMLDEMIRSAEDIEKYLQLDILTIIPFSEEEVGSGGAEQEV